MAAVLSSLEPLVRSLRMAGYTVVGPTMRDGAIVLSELDSAAELPMYAFLGVRPCDLRATAVQDRVLGVGCGYAARRRELPGRGQPHRAVGHLLLRLRRRRPGEYTSKET